MGYTLEEMRSTFGLQLIEEGLIPREALYEALRLQRARGGLLGTCLLALGKLRRGDLLQALARHLGRPPAPPSRVLYPDPGLASLWDAGLLRRLRALPYAVNGEGVEVAFADPRRLDALAALSPPFDGGIVRLRVAVEPDVDQGLLRLLGPAPTASAGPPRPPLARELLGEDPAARLPMPPRAAPARAQVASAPAPGASGGRFRDEAEIAFAQATGFDKERTAVFRLDALAEEERRQRAPGEALDDDALPSPPTAPRLAEAAEGLFEARNEGVLARRLVAFYGAYFPRVLLLARHGETLRGILGHGLELSGPEVAALRIPAAAFDRLFEGAPGYYGPPPGDARLEPLYQALGEPAVNVLLLPVTPQPPPAWLVYADHGPRIERYDDVHDLTTMGKEASIALNLLREADGASPG